MQVAMTVAATKIQILQEKNLSQAEESLPSPGSTTPSEDKDQACST